MQNIDLNKAHCYWVTGLSGSGKTTISTLLKKRIEAKGLPVILLDGDILRKVLDSQAYSYEDRRTLGFKYARLCQILVSQGFNVVIGVICLFHDIQSWNKENILNYVEIFLDTPLDELKRRDVKGIYKQLKSGQISNVAGGDIVAEFPLAPDVKILWDKNKDVKKSFKELLLKLNL